MLENAGVPSLDDATEMISGEKMKIIINDNSWIFWTIIGVTILLALIFYCKCIKPRFDRDRNFRNMQGISNEDRTNKLMNMLG